MKRHGRHGSVFKNGFLKAYRRQDESDSASEAILSGRWKIVEREKTFQLFREWEDEAADEPFATFYCLDHALLFAGIAPASSRVPVYEGGEEENGWVIFCDGREVGKLQWRDDEILAVLNVAGYLVRNPIALAYLLEAAGPSAMEAVGKFLHQRTMREESRADGAAGMVQPHHQKEA